MQVKPALTVLLASTLSLGWSGLASAEVAAKYDAFKDKTTIILFGKQVHNKPLLYAWHQSDGQKPNLSQSAMVGFISSRACTNPNFLADGKRVQPKPGSDSPLNPHLMPMDMGEGAQRVPGVYSFNFYKLPQIKQIATAKSVQYKLCDQVFTLSPQEQAELRKFLSYFK
jgi:hypothetical protein